MSKNLKSKNYSLKKLKEATRRHLNGPLLIFFEVVLDIDIKYYV